MNRSRKARINFFYETFPKGRLSVLAGEMLIGKSDFMISLARFFNPKKLGSVPGDSLFASFLL